MKKLRSEKDANYGHGRIQNGDIKPSKSLERHHKSYDKINIHTKKN